MICEDPVVQLIQEDFLAETGFFLGELFGSGVVRHADYPFIHATVDRLLVDADGKFSGILEIKTVKVKDVADVLTNILYMIKFSDHFQFSWT